MSDKTVNLDTWMNHASEYKLPSWEQLSSIPLYMDQVLLFMNDAFSLFEHDETNTILTSSMINNYVKNGLVEHPVHKKYSREHLAKLVMIGMLKQILSIQDVSVLLAETDDLKAFYNAFKDAQDAALHDTLNTLTDAQSNQDILRATALRLAAEANARQAVAQQILLELSHAQPSPASKTKKNTKSK